MEAALQLGEGEMEASANLGRRRTTPPKSLIHESAY
jgi:hypothetical protein